MFCVMDYLSWESGMEYAEEKGRIQNTVACLENVQQRFKAYVICG